MVNDARARGDWQTPAELARAITALLRSCGEHPRSLVEPTAGRGSLLVAGLSEWPGILRGFAMELDPTHMEELRASLPSWVHVETKLGDALREDWPARLAALPGPVLVLANPPWVTRSELGTLSSSNLPPLRCPSGMRGIEALTGGGNFDLGAWIIARMVNSAPEGTSIAALCKTSAVRRILEGAWAAGLPLGSATLWRIDAKRWFGATVSACLFLCHPQREGDPTCEVFDDLNATAPSEVWGWRGGRVVRDARAWDRLEHLALASGPQAPTWRSGIKHDSAATFELREGPAGLLTLDGAVADVERARVFPLASATDLARDRWERSGRRLLVPREGTGESDPPLELAAPRLWQHLMARAGAVDARASRIYRGRPRFAQFGVGPYSFALWKVAISGLCAEPRFRVLGPLDGRPWVVDDASYLLPCSNEAEAWEIAARLGTEDALDFLRSMIFPDAKRPITVDLLRRLNLAALSRSSSRGSAPHR